MPQSDLIQTEQQSRTLAYGPAHHRKTWWAIKAAEAGFNVVVFDCDNNMGILDQLPTEVRKRIFIINIVDDLQESHAQKFLLQFFKGQAFLWDEDAKVTQLIYKTADKSHHFVEIKPGLLDFNTIIVMDSYTAYIESLRHKYFKTKGVDLTANPVRDGDWGDYRWTGEMADYIPKVLKHFKCHFIFTAHETHFEKKDKDDKEKIIISRKQVVGTSNNQSMRLAKYFNDILYFEMVGSEVWIDGRASADRDGGCIHFPLAKKRWDDMAFGKFVKPTTPGGPLSGFKFYRPGELPEVAGTPLQIAPVIQGNQSTGTTSNTENKPAPIPAKTSLFNLMNKDKAS